MGFSAFFEKVGDVAKKTGKNVVKGAKRFQDYQDKLDKKRYDNIKSELKRTKLKRQLLSEKKKLASLQKGDRYRFGGF